MKDFSIKKLYYSISEVSKITNLEQYVLRYWESEFDELKPAKNRAGNRIYTNKDIQLILFIKKLLRDERYTIEGAKQVLKTYTPGQESDFGREEDEQIEDPAQTALLFEPEGKLREDLLKVRQFLEELRERIRG
ncbi:MAG: MerR family transcriptional regulator [Bacteroidota bacterium]|jgi:DNA-binding transcriptional MerR regulator|nr:MerR family transcriptional regulator [Bacteroidota bacterium]